MRYLVVVVVCALVVLALVTANRGGPSAEPLTSAGQLADLCLRGTTFPDAAPYTSEAPPTIAVFDAPRGNGGDDSVDRIPAQALGELPDATAVQLVACVRRASGGEQVGECRFDSGEPVPLHTARYEVTVYVAQTGEEVGNYDDGADGVDCPVVALVDGERPKVFSMIPREQLMQSLSAFVDTLPAPSGEGPGG